MELHRANLIAVTPVDSVPADIRPFIDFKAAIEKLELKGNEQVAIFLVETTACYIPIFLDKGSTVERIKEELARQDVEIPINQEAVIRERLKALFGERIK
jgi:hypothetical protein